MQRCRIPSPHIDTTYGNTFANNKIRLQGTAYESIPNQPIFPNQVAPSTSAPATRLIFHSPLGISSLTHLQCGPNNCSICIWKDRRRILVSVCFTIPPTLLIHVHSSDIWIFLSHGCSFLNFGTPNLLSVTFRGLSPAVAYSALHNL